MNILFLTTGRMESIEQHAIYPDLLRQFRNHGHNVYCVSAFEKHTGKETEYIEDHSAHLLHVKIGNLTKTNVIEKGISTLSIEGQYLNAIKKYLSDVKFDLILYSTPPITFAKVIEYIKKRDGAKTYLLLKDIFPQNAVDMGMLSKTGPKSVLYKFFRNKEKKLYAISDHIGCKSQANVDYVVKQNPEVDTAKVEICPNCIEVVDKSVDEQTRVNIRNKYGLPLEKKVFVYGGNLGKPQGIPFVIECLKKCRDIEDAYFLIVGDGTEYHVLEEYAQASRQSNLKLMKRLPKEDYDTMVAACDVGLVFLDHRFTIPNFPSRLLAYMQAKLPILACTDPNTDIGKVIVDGGFGWWCESCDTGAFNKTIETALCPDFNDEIGNRAWGYLNDNYTAKIGYQIITEAFGGGQ